MFRLVSCYKACKWVICLRADSSSSHDFVCLYTLLWCLFITSG